jgi:hexosaminidase
MKNLNLIFILVLSLLFSCKKPVIVNTGIIPQPNSINYQQGQFQITAKTVIIIDDSEDLKRISNRLNAFLKTNFNLELAVTSKVQENAISLLKSNEKQETGAYNLSISKKGIDIKSASYQGIFYGFQSLKQLLTPKATITNPILSFVEINDAPKFQWRGTMLDVSRHFQPIDSVKKVIDMLAMHKMNKFHWHLVDGIGWRIQIDAYPELTTKGAWRKVKEDKKPWEDFEISSQNAEGEVYGGFYTKAEIKELVAYASERYIDVIPEIEMPGHSEAALQCYPEFTCVGAESSGVYCAGNDGSFEFLQNIIAEVVELFPYKYIHIGGDEVGKEGWMQCKKCKKRMQTEGLRTAEELQSYFVKRMEVFIDSKNKKLIGWDEILEGGLPERATVMSWRGVAGGIEAANAGHDVVMSPGSPCYFDHSQGKSELEPPSWGGYNNLLSVYDFNPVPKEISEDKKHHILGGQANLWTEHIKTLEHIEYMLLPRLSALSEALWTNTEQKDKDFFIDKLDFHFDRLAEQGYNYATSALTPDYSVKYNKNIKEFSLSLKNEIDRYEIRYTLDGSTPTINSTLYTKPINYSTPIHLNARCFRYNKPVGFTLEKLFSTSFSDQCKVIYNNAYNEGYSGGGDKALFNSKFATSRGDDTNWQGFQQKDFDVIVDLGSVSELTYISLNFFQHIAATSVMLPTKVIIEVSEDGKNYTTVLNEEISTTKKRDPIIKKIETEFKKQPIGFIKIKAKNRGELPDWHIRKGDAWVFVDEISVK